MLSQEVSVRAATARPRMSARIVGYDVARAIAILGMIIVHFSVAMVPGPGHAGWLQPLVHFWEGRAVALFVILAGIGLSMITGDPAAQASSEAIAARRATLVKRGLFLLALGLLNLLIWPGDILRVYGVSFLLVALVFRRSNRLLLGLAALFALGFVALLLRFDFSQHWDWATLAYRDLWTIKGGLRNLFFDGFRSVFPWTGLLFFGMWLGRQDLRAPTVNRAFVLGGVAVAAAAHVASAALQAWLIDGGILASADAQVLFGTESIPPLPLFLLSAGGFAVAVIALSVRLADALPGHAAVRALGATGQFALTWYVVHIVLGLGGIAVLGLLEKTSLATALLASLGFFGAAVACSLAWKRRFARGPLEWLMRQVAG